MAIYKQKLDNLAFHNECLRTGLSYIFSFEARNEIFNYYNNQQAVYEFNPEQIRGAWKEVFADTPNWLLHGMYGKSIVQVFDLGANHRLLFFGD
jgi:hypothetical protein